MNNYLIEVVLKKFVPLLAVAVAGGVLAIGGFALKDDCIVPLGSSISVLE